MANKEKIDYLLIDIRELEKLVAGMRDAEIYPASFFNQTFQLTHKVLKELHTLEEFQLEALRKQMEEHQRLIDSIPVSKPLQMPEVQPAPEVSPTIEVVQVQEPVVEEPIVVEPIVEKEIPEEKIVQETIPLKEIEIPHKTILADKSSISLNDILEKKNLSDFRKAFSLNDRFRFRRELFGGNEEKMNKAPPYRAGASPRRRRGGRRQRRSKTRRSPSSAASLRFFSLYNAWCSPRFVGQGVCPRIFVRCRPRCSGRWRRAGRSGSR